MNILKSYERSPYLSSKHNTYFPVYEELFSQFTGKHITFIEVGVQNGGSLFMWRDFLGPKARIIGVDLNPLAKKWEGHGFEIFIGSQADCEFWNKLYEIVGKVDVVLDDGGHTYNQQIVTAEASIPHIRDGGMLVVEDTHTSYMERFGGPTPRSFVNYARNVTDGINYRFSEFASEKLWEPAVWSVRFFESVVAFDINRRLAALASAPTSNQGISSQALDFRDNDLVHLDQSQLDKYFKY